MTTYTFKQLCAFVHGGLSELFKPDSIGVEKISTSHVRFITRCYFLELFDPAYIKGHTKWTRCAFYFGSFGKRVFFDDLNEAFAFKILENAQWLKDELS